MGLYESNFIRLGWLAGTLKALRGSYTSTVRGDCDLVLTVLDRSPYTSTVNLTYLIPGSDGPRPYPDMRVRIYHDAHLVEAQQWNSGHSCAAGAPPHPLLRALRSHAERELDQRWARNMMLNGLNTAGRVIASSSGGARRRQLRSGVAASLMKAPTTRFSSSAYGRTVR
jgi:uncharacterized protein YqiB (DUF1249 family)